MRIITGKAKGLKLKAPRGLSTRPTADRIKESTFNILSGLIEFEGLKVMDIFAGTGALGLEAISRGAAFCTFIDKETANTIKHNVKRGHFEEAAEVISGEAIRTLKAQAKSNKEYDIIFSDPPYRMGLWQRSLKEVDESKLLKPEGLMIVEHGADETIDIELKNLECIRQMGYGKTTAVDIFKRKVDSEQ